MAIATAVNSEPAPTARTDATITPADQAAAAHRGLAEQAGGRSRSRRTGSCRAGPGPTGRRPRPMAGASGRRRASWSATSTIDGTSSSSSEPIASQTIAANARDPRAAGGQISPATRSRPGRPPRSDGQVDGPAGPIAEQDERGRQRPAGHQRARSAAARMSERARPRVYPRRHRSRPDRAPASTARHRTAGSSPGSRTGHNIRLPIKPDSGRRNGTIRFVQSGE